MDKRFLTYDEQIIRLRENKKVTMKDEKEVLKTLQKYSYYNFVNSIKLCFAEGKNNDGSHIYSTSEFELWRICYEETNIIKNRLVQLILETETTLNSLLSYYITKDYLETKKLKNFTSSYIACCMELDEFKDTEYFDVCKEVVYKSWIYVPKLTFGKIVDIYSKIPVDFKTQHNSIFNYSYKELKIMVGIRNKLVHNTPLLIMLNDRNSKFRNSKRNLVKKMLKSNTDFSTMYKKYDTLIANYNEKVAQFGNENGSCK